jgi:hypothetical protein
MAYSPQPRAGFAAAREPELLQDRGQAHRALSGWPDHLW